MKNNNATVFMLVGIVILLIININLSKDRIEQLEFSVEYLEQQIVDINVNRSEIEELRVELYEVADVRDWQTTEVQSRIDILEAGLENLQEQFEEVSLQRVFITDSE